MRPQWPNDREMKQTKVALEDVAVGNARAHREGRIDQCVDIDAFEVLANERESGVRTQVIGQSLDKKVGHVLAHLQGELDLVAKCLISIKKPPKSHVEVTDSGKNLA